MKPEDRGSKEFELPHGVVNWPNCKVPDCTKQVCVRLNYDFCFPHYKLLVDENAE